MTGKGADAGARGGPHQRERWQQATLAALDLWSACPGGTALTIDTDIGIVIIAAEVPTILKNGLYRPLHVPALLWVERTATAQSASHAGDMKDPSVAVMP